MNYGLIVIAVLSAVVFVFGWTTLTSLKSYSTKTVAAKKTTPFQMFETPRIEHSSSMGRFIRKVQAPIHAVARPSRMPNGKEVVTHTNNGRKILATIVGSSRRGYVLKAAGSPNGGTFRRKLAMAA